MTHTKTATAVEISKNGKTGAVSATYAAQVTCPSVCPLRNAGCYAELGRSGITTSHLAAAADSREATAYEVACEEAAAIDGLSGKRPLRLHVVGDCATDETAEVVSAAADRYHERGGKPVWTYTHAWRTVNRGSWGGVSVRASCETLDEVAEARQRGYVPVVVVAEHPADGKAYATDSGKVVPCPEQTRGVSCDSCGLCWTSTATIAFAAHGPRTRAVKEMVGAMA